MKTVIIKEEKVLNRVKAAHILRDEKTQEILSVQTISEHSEGVACLARQFAEDFQAGEIGYVCGILHDYGKNTEGFQKRIWDNAPKLDHSTAGAYEILKRESGLYASPGNARETLDLLKRNPAALIAAYCITGHHSGLLDGGDVSCKRGTLSGRICNRKEENFCADEESHYDTISLPRLIAKPEHRGFGMSFFIRMVFSCLVDADYLDTEAFMNPEKASHRPDAQKMNDLRDLALNYIKSKGFLEGKEGLNWVRSKILSECISSGEKMMPGLSSLTVPTGGGKTIASLAFALHHAVKHGMTRIIYVIPYCSIIDQTVSVFEDILGEKNVLAHYSDVTFEESEEKYNPKRLAAENWDLPVIVTTAVQFFESIYSNRPGACRKLHNIANSVIIFDEAQTIPISYLVPCVDAIGELALNYHTTCVLCTATQPALENKFRAYHDKLDLKEISPSAMEYKEIFRRVKYQKEGVLPDEELARRMTDEGEILCVVRSRRQAKQVFELIESETKYHLSTLMTPRDRKRVIGEIRDRIKSGMPCCVVSTSLIEAGVDLDFQEVYRAYTGLDSEIQAAGRCNREGHRPVSESIVHLFEPESKYRIPDALRLSKEVGESVIRDTTEIDDPTVIQNYFLQLYDLSGYSRLDQHGIEEKLDNGIKKGSFPFAEIAGNFHLIEQNTWSVIIQQDEISRQLCAQLLDGTVPLSKEEYRKLGKYTVSIYEDQYKTLAGSLSVTGERQAVLINSALYDENTGLALEDKGGEGLFF